jgi:hypothetical protein
VYPARADFGLNLGSGGSWFEVIPDSGRERYNPPHKPHRAQNSSSYNNRVICLISSSWGWWLLAAATGGITIWIVVYLLRRAKRAEAKLRLLEAELQRLETVEVFGGDVAPAPQTAKWWPWAGLRWRFSYRRRREEAEQRRKLELLDQVVRAGRQAAEEKLQQHPERPKPESKLNFVTPIQPEVPSGILIDNVHFTLTGPERLSPGAAHELCFGSTFKSREQQSLQ